jgi:hypothetical protein
MLAASLFPEIYQTYIVRNRCRRATGSGKRIFREPSSANPLAVPREMRQ